MEIGEYDDYMTVKEMGVMEMDEEAFRAALMRSIERGKKNYKAKAGIEMEKLEEWPKRYGVEMVLMKTQHGNQVYWEGTNVPMSRKSWETLRALYAEDKMLEAVMETGITEHIYKERDGA